MSDKSNLISMLAGAGIADSNQHIQVDDDVRDGDRYVTIHTGPDDAIAVFRFDDAGTIKTVEVLES